MSYFLNLMTLFMVLAFSVKTFALESTDVLKVSILKVYEKNILVLNRGAEDGIFRKDHIKIASTDGFIARGICIKSTMLTSHWKIYRVVRPELVSKDTEYTMRSINQSAIPKDLSRYAQVDFSAYTGDYGDKDVLKGLELQEERIAKYDLPNRIEETNAFREEKKTDLQNFMEKNISEGDAARDFGNMHFELFASPISWQSRNKQEESHYGGKIHNIGTKYRYQINAVERRLSMTDPVSEQTYRSKSSHYDMQFQVNRATENTSLVSYASYDREKIGRIYYPYKAYQVGVIGLRYHVWEENPKDQFVDITYIPVFDNFDYTDPTTDKIDNRVGIRHRFQVRFYSYFSKKVHNQTEILYAPFMSSEDGFGIDNKNVYSEVNTKFSFDLENNFFFDYMAQFSKDDFRHDIYNIDAQNITQTVRLRYAFSL